MDENEIKVGYALSDVVEEHENLRNILELTSLPDTLELQPEKFLWNLNEAKDYLDKVKFLSVHAPAANLDLSSHDQRERYESILATLKGMDIANELDANTLVIHPINNMHLNPQERLQRKNKFLEVFQNDIAPHYSQNGHRYKICLENIEYPKLPSTLEETLILTEEASKFMDAYMILDVPHIWNSRRILRENPDYYRELTPGFPGDESLETYFNNFVEKYDDKIALYHIAGFGENPVETHNPITEELVEKDYLKLIKNIKRKPVILEIHHPSYIKMVESRENLIKYFNTEEI